MNTSIRASIPTSIRTQAPAFRRPALATLILAALATGSAHAGVGAKIGLQLWDPTARETERVVVPYDNPRVLSDAVAKAWEMTRGPLCNMLINELGKANRFAKGVTLYEIQCLLQPNENFSVRSLGPNQLEFSVLLKHNTFIAKSTTPGILPQSTDPKASVDFDFDLRVSINIQPQTAKTIEITNVYAGFSATRIDSQNFTADVAKGLNAAWAFVGGTDFKRMAEGMLNNVSTSTLPGTNGQSLGASMKTLANQQLAPVNAALTPPANYVKVGAWFHQGKVVLAFAPRNLPQPALTGVVEGAIRWPATLVAQDGCASFSLRTRVQTGPSAITGPDFGLGAAPMQEFGQYIASGVPMAKGNDMECRYRLVGVPAMFAGTLVPAAPKLVEPGARAVSASASINAPFSLPVLRRDGWSEQYVLPPVNAANRNFVAVLQTIKPTVPLAQKPTLQPATPVVAVPGKPVAKPVIPGPVVAGPVVAGPALPKPVIAAPIVQAPALPATVAVKPAAVTTIARPVTTVVVQPARPLNMAPLKLETLQR